MRLTVVFEETGEARPVTRGCKRCRVSEEEIRTRSVVVAPSGIAHRGADYGMTDCGIDATGDGYWWPL